MNARASGVRPTATGPLLLLLFRPHLSWALIFLGVNSIYLPLLEEPSLANRFGEAYLEYCRQVPRLVPRWRA